MLILLINRMPFFAPSFQFSLIAPERLNNVSEIESLYQVKYTHGFSNRSLSSKKIKTTASKLYQQKRGKEKKKN